MAHRAERKNDTILMGKIDSIITSLNKQDTEIAVIKTINAATESHLGTLNGKVQAHESRLQAQEGSVALNAQILANIVDAAKETRSFWERNWEKLFWFVLAGAWAYLNIK